MVGAPKGYKWGRAQGWIIVCLGLPLFIGVSFEDVDFVQKIPFLMVGAFLIAEGLGLVGKRKFGLIMLYAQLVLTGISFLAPLPSYPETVIVRLLIIGFLLIPGLAYYPKRWSEFW